MSEALDRLEHLRIGVQYINQNESPAFIAHYEEDIDIIEVELKDYKLLKERTKLDSFECLLRLEEILPRGKELLVPVAKELKAFEIIKKYPFVIRFIQTKQSYSDLAITMPNTEIPTKEEYELLKEVLL